jgi:hypothetical protein
MMEVLEEMMQTWKICQHFKVTVVLEVLMKEILPNKTVVVEVD